jgi:hypothetical protein
MPYAQLGAFYLTGCHPPLQRHGRNAHGAGSLLRVTSLCHTVIYITHLGLLVKLFVLLAVLPNRWYLDPIELSSFPVCSAG